jgi:hypothetical protein
MRSGKLMSSESEKAKCKNGYVWTKEVFVFEGREKEVTSEQDKQECGRESESEKK